nr:TMEM165/GDT1 family protein [Schwartzia sp. (in: firmicutes)]
LAVLTIAAERGTWLPVLAGSTAAMLIADGLGVVLGSKLRKHVAPETMKKVSAGVFILCSIAGLVSIFA